MRLRFTIYFYVTVFQQETGTTVGYEHTGGSFSMLISKNENCIFFVNRVQKIHRFSTLPAASVSKNVCLKVLSSHLN
jgi:hypothetical protein